MKAPTALSTPIAQTGHVGINVTRLDRSVDFYRAVLGLDVLQQSKEAGREFAFLGHGGKIVLTLWQQGSEAFDARRAGLHHLSFEVDGVERLRESMRTLKDLGIPLRYDGVVPHAEGMDSGGVYFDDPDGVRLEIYTLSGVGGYAAPTPGAPSCGFF